MREVRHLSPRLPGKEVAPTMLSIVIVTRNTRDLLDALLASVAGDASLKASTREVVVVDNASEDDTEGMVRTQHPWVSYTRSDTNRGFAAAVNEGYRRSTGDLVLFLNSDTRLLPGETVKILSFMERETAVGIAAPQLVYEDMRPQRSFAPAPSLLLEVFPRPFLERMFPARFPTKGKDVAVPLDVESVIGAAVMVRREVLDALGGFDERFFFFLEETDLCLRARQKGYRVVFFPGARVVHLQGRTVRQSWINGRIEYSISLYKFIRKHHSALYYSSFVSVRVCKAFLAALFLSLVPVFVRKESITRKQMYYVQLLLWHVSRCPDHAGLRASSQG